MVDDQVVLIKEYCEMTSYCRWWDTTNKTSTRQATSIFLVIIPSHTFSTAPR